MSRKVIVKASFNDDLQEESYYFIKRLIEKILLNQLELSPTIQGKLLTASSKIIEEETIKKE